ncbi:5-oxoprolinase subunit C family protein [Thermoflavimicrobium dichotomicum]|uniref:Antagonist of KipI n=1 Tax=Thermoflavimicrobium dichotomicum TaxID=46223 RepID=A0A1I3L4L3_9BACL|nr:biotin-dependent carboxyltransferase family protein [Thermoflavimicrobium dichotomicum]SFI79546.1 antagonist of KipI [Thermoflavimicrobium dichotomicum]
MGIHVIQPGLLTTIQDGGRFGFQKFGVVVGGAMDSFAYRIANLLVGNRETEAALEITLMGPTLAFQEDVVIAICGGDLSPSINHQPIPNWRPIYVKKGSILRFGPCVSGCRAYLAVAGGIDVTPVLGSYSTYLRGQFGGFHGRALKRDDVLPLKSQPICNRVKRFSIKKDQPFVLADFFVSPDILPRYQKDPVIRFLPGKEYDLFTPEAHEIFERSFFQVTPQSDRMGYRLEGPVLSLKQSVEMISEAVTFGTVQVPADGKPIVLMADRQTTGGYPKLAQVITVDLPVLAQVKPGEKITFSQVTISEAERLYLEQESNIRLLQARIQLYWSQGGI